jgi:hypothetical protein
VCGDKLGVAEPVVGAKAFAVKFRANLANERAMAPEVIAVRAASTMRPMPPETCVSFFALT